MPYDIALSMKPAEVAAHAIVFGEFEGNEFDWNAMNWKPRK